MSLRVGGFEVNDHDHCRDYIIIEVLIILLDKHFHYEWMIMI